MNFKTANILIGWLLFLVSTTIYFLCCEPTVSWWDCGEYISTSYKLQVGHPPGAPLFQLIGRFFCFFAGNDVTKVALMMNRMSALASGFTILFLFWSITHFAKKIVGETSDELNLQKKVVIFFSGIVGALVYTFSDTFWFSAVESEVYAMSSLFTAITFWAILKWEEQFQEKDSFRWIVLVFFLIGLSIGVHLLNLLAIPAVVFVVYFKKYSISFKGIFFALCISLGLLALLLWGIIPYLIIFWSWFELFFSRNLGFFVGAGSFVYFGLLVLLLFGSLFYAVRQKKKLLNNIVLCLLFLIIGYSSFALLIIRANAGTPINEGNPDNGFALSAYLERDQYGKTPLFYGEYYTAPAWDYIDGKPTYAKQYSVYKDSEKNIIASFFDKYETEDFVAKNPKEQYRIKTSYGLAFDGKGGKLAFPKGFSTLFPRMWNSSEQYKHGYEIWGGHKGKSVIVDGETYSCPTFSENLRFFVSYQLGYMYFRYFMWNFSGKFNELQGRGGLQDGQWITGFDAIDKHLTHLSGEMPENMKSKGHNVYYMLPLFLGLIGFLFQLKRNSKDTFVVTLLFIFTGIAIVVYLNTPAYQPRERDYAFAASFYAFAIWVGLGVAGLCALAQEVSKRSIISLFIGLLCLTIPVLMARQNWDDHDRSHRTIALDAAKNYLESCEKNAILFTFGDNDTFPLWYAQEVEGIRTDVRVVNFSLLAADWYIDQCKRKIYESDALPVSLSKNAYISQNRDVVIVKRGDEIMPLDSAITFLSHANNYIMLGENKKFFICPVSRFSLNVDTETAKQWVLPQFQNKLKPKIVVEYKDDYLLKNNLIALDIIAHNHWERPIYFTHISSPVCEMFDKYIQNNGFVYQLVPVKVNKKNGEEPIEEHFLNVDGMYDILINKGSFGKLSTRNIYLDEVSMHTAKEFREKFALLTTVLFHENKKDSALKAVEKALAAVSSRNFVQDVAGFQIAEVLLKLGKPEKAFPVFEEIVNVSSEKFVYYTKQNRRIQRYFNEEIYSSYMLIQGVFVNSGSSETLHRKAKDRYFSNASKYLSFCSMELAYYFGKETSTEDIAQISKLMESISYIIQHARDNQQQEIRKKAEELMKKSITAYNQLIETSENK